MIDLLLRTRFWNAMRQLHELGSLVRRHGREGATHTGASGLTLYLASRPTQPMPVVYEPLLCLIVDGAKRTVLGDRVFRYGAGDFMTASVHLPVSGEVIAAPYAALSLPLDPAKIASLLLETPLKASADAPTVGLHVSRAEPDLLDAVTRLVRLLDRPGDLPVLAPMIEREVLWRLLQSRSGDVVRQIAWADSRLSQVSRAIGWLREHYAEPARVEDLARLAGMSAASLHRHFKAVTAMSPLQYQKQVRLQEARSRLLARRGDVAGIGFDVGYNSPSQFSREYARMFGAPPARDADRLRQNPRVQVAIG